MGSGGVEGQAADDEAEAEGVILHDNAKAKAMILPTSTWKELLSWNTLQNAHATRDAFQRMDVGWGGASFDAFDVINGWARHAEDAWSSGGEPTIGLSEALTVVAMLAPVELAREMGYTGTHRGWFFREWLRRQEPAKIWTACYRHRDRARWP